MWNQQKFDNAARVIQRDRPERLSMVDERAHGFYTDMDVQPDGSLLLCTGTYSEDGQVQRHCEVFL